MDILQDQIELTDDDEEKLLHHTSKQIYFVSGLFHVQSINRILKSYSSRNNTVFINAPMLQ